MATAEESKLAKVGAEVDEGNAVADEKLVQEAVKHIQGILAETVIKGMVDVGAYLLKHFFNNDPELVRSRNPSKNASFRILVERCGTELPVSKSWLNNAVGVAIMSKALPGQAAFKQLPQSHQTVLLPLHEPTKIEEVAARAVKKDLSVRDLRDVVRREVAKNKDDNRGRPAKPLIVKTLDRSLKLFTLESGRKSFTKAQVNELSEEDAKHVRDAAGELMASLKKLIEQLPRK